MHILMLNHNVIWRSTFFRAFYIARELVDLGHTVSLVTVSPRNVFKPQIDLIEGVTVIQTPDFGVSLARTGWDLWDTLFRVNLARKAKYDIVHGFDCRPVVLAPSLYLRFLRDVPWVSDWADWWGHGGAIAERKSWIGRVAFAPIETALEEKFRRFATQLTVTSRALQQRAIDLGIPSEEVHYIPSGSNVRDITPQDAAACRAELGLPQDVPLACFVGFVQYDLDLVIRAFAEARRRQPSAQLLLVGPGNRSATRLINELGLTAAVHQAGIQPFSRVSRYLGAADLLLMPCSDNLMNRARGPIKLGDYLAAGRPILANPVGDMVEIFERDDVGVMTSDSPQEYGAAMADLLANKPRLLAMGHTARKVAEERYAWQHIAPQVERVYLKSKQSKRASP